MTTESKLGGSDAWGNGFVGLYIRDSLGGTLLRITRVDTERPWVWYEFVNLLTAEPIGEQGDMDGLEFIEMLREGSYEIYSQREVLEKARAGSGLSP